jgi:hypothetical protein
MSVLDKVRRWIDGETAETVLEDAARDAQIKPRSQAEEFIVKLARSVEEVMQREMVPLPQGSMLIPTEYIIFLSEADDKEWQGVKRRGLEQGLYHILAERAKEISGKKKLETQSFAVELRVDGTLEKDEVRVQHSWEDSSSSEKTGVFAKPKAQQPSQIKNANPVAPLQNNFAPSQSPQTSPNSPPATIPQMKAPQYVTNSPADDEEEMTQVKKRTVELYRLEIWRGGVRQTVIPVYQNEITIGRGSKSKPVDIPLSGDPEISRRHATITRDASGNFWFLNEGRNASFVANREIPVGQRVAVSPGETIAVCSYLLRIQPR